MRSTQRHQQMSNIDLVHNEESNRKRFSCWIQHWEKIIISHVLETILLPRFRVIGYNLIPLLTRYKTVGCARTFVNQVFDLISHNANYTQTSPPWDFWGPWTLSMSGGSERKRGGRAGQVGNLHKLSSEFNKFSSRIFETINETRCNEPLPILQIPKTE